MSLIGIVISLVLVGLALYLINKYIPMEPWVKKVINIVAVVVVVIWLLKAFDLWKYLFNVHT